MQPQEREDRNGDRVGLLADEAGGSIELRWQISDSSKNYNETRDLKRSDEVDHSTSTNDLNDFRNRWVVSSCMKKVQQFCFECCGIDDDDDESKVSRKACFTFAESSLAIAVYYAFQYVIHNPTCNFLFKCGCTWTWAGGWKHCNIWNSSGPKCPWCMSRAYISWTTDYLVFAIMLMTYLFCLYNRKRIHSSIRLLSPIIMYFVSSIVVGLAFKIFTNYPYFIF